MSTPDYTYLRQQLRKVSDCIVCGAFSKNETVAALLEAETALGHLMYVCRYYEVKAEAGETPAETIGALRMAEEAEGWG